MLTKRKLLTGIVIAGIAITVLVVIQVETFTSNQRSINDRVLVKSGLIIYCASEPLTSKPTCDKWVQTVMDNQYVTAKTCYDQYDYLKQTADFGSCLHVSGVVLP